MRVRIWNHELRDEKHMVFGIIRWTSFSRQLLFMIDDELGVGRVEVFLLSDFYMIVIDVLHRI